MVNISSNKRVLIAGISGNLGSYLYTNIKNKDNIFSIGRDENTTQNYNKLNFNSTSQMDLFFENAKCFDIFIFFIGLAHNKGDASTFSNHHHTNYEILKNLLSSARKQNKVPKKIIYTSTISVYGERYSLENYNEDLKPIPFSPYAITKRKAEELLIEKYQDISWILRLGPVYSKNFMLNIKRRTKFLGFHTRIGSGNNKLSLCNIKNIGFVIEHIINNKIPNGVYNLVDGVDYSYNDLIKLYNKKNILRIPRFFIFLIYYFSEKLNFVFLKENSIKLITNNIFSSKKIQKFIALPYSLKDL